MIGYISYNTNPKYKRIGNIFYPYANVTFHESRFVNCKFVIDGKEYEDKREIRDYRSYEKLLDYGFFKSGEYKCFSKFYKSTFQVNYKEYKIYIDDNYSHHYAGYRACVEAVLCEYFPEYEYEIEHNFLSVNRFNILKHNPIEVVGQYGNNHSIIGYPDSRKFMLLKEPTDNIDEELQIKTFGADWKDKTTPQMAQLMIKRIYNHKNGKSYEHYF